MNKDILLSTKFKSIGEDATVSMPSQIKALFGMNPQIDVRLIDYDYIGDAKDDDYTSFAEKLYKANPNAHYILVFPIPILYGEQSPFQEVHNLAFCKGTTMLY